MRRLSVVLLPAALILALIAGYTLWHASDALPGLGRIQTSGLASVGGPFVLTDQDGARRTDKNFRGHYMLIYFGYSMCPDVCPTTLALMSDALSKLGPNAKQIVPIFITLDPERDTTTQLKAYLRAFGPRFVGLTGDRLAIARVAAEYRVFFKKRPVEGGGYGVDHSSVIYLMGPDGKFITYWDDTSIRPATLAQELHARI